MTRGDFLKGASALAVAATIERGGAQSHEPTGVEALDARQAEIDAITPKAFKEYLERGITLPPEELEAMTREHPVLARLEAAFDKVLSEAKETTVTDANSPAIWYVYNMGLVVKTPKTMFAIDLNHRRAEEFAPLLDFAMITHNHTDHYTERFKYAMDRIQHKTVVNNFFDNYGVHDWKTGGYTRAKSKTFHFGDVTVITGLCDHNNYLVDYTTTFEVHVGDFTLFHSGDCCSSAKLNVTRQPDLWVLHPRCGMDPSKACAEAIKPKKAVIAHLQELGHAKGRYRWTYRDGLNIMQRIESAGVAATMPLWGDKIYGA